jgi:O-antigen ligase
MSRSPATDQWLFGLVVLTVWTSVVPVAYVFHIGSFGIAPYEIFEGLALVVCGVQWIRGRLTLAWPTGLAWLLVFMALTSASALLAENARNVVALLGRFWLSWLMVFLLPTVLRDRARFGAFIGAMIVQAVVLIGLSLAGDVRAFGWPSLPRLFLAQFQKNEYATYLAFAVAVALVALNTDLVRPWVRKLAAAVPVLAVVSWPLTYSRSGLVAIVGTLALIVVLVRTRRIASQVVGIVLLGGVVWLALPGNVKSTSGRAVTSLVSPGALASAAPDVFDQTVRDRLVLDWAALGIIARHPVTGLGLTRWEAQSPVKTKIRDVKSQQVITVGATVHNRYLLIAVESGLPTLVGYLGFLAYLLTSAFRLRSRVAPEMRVVLDALIACTLSLQVAMLTMPGTLWEWNQVALLVAAERLASQSVADAARSPKAA